MAAESRPCGDPAFIWYEAATGWITGNELVDVRGGCRYHTGIGFVGNEGRTSWVEISGNRIKDFNQSGIFIGRAGPRTVIQGNIIQMVQRPEYSEEESTGVLFLSGAATVNDNAIFVDPSAFLQRGFLFIKGDVAMRRNIVAGGDISIFSLDSRGLVARSRVTGEILLRGGGPTEVRTNRGTGGIRLESGGNFIHDNDFSGSSCLDSTKGDGTAGTANVWRRNVADGSDPDGICKPAP